MPDYSFDGSGSTVEDQAGSADFSIAGRDVVRVAGHTNEGLWSVGTSMPSLPDVGRANERTVAMWLKAPAGVYWPICWLVPSIDSGAWGILMLNSDIAIQARNAGGLARATWPWPTDGQPHHVCGTFDGATVRLYLDGALVSSTALAGPLRTDTDPPIPLLDAGDRSGFPGYIDDLRIRDVAFTLTEVVAGRDTPVGVDIRSVSVTLGVSTELLPAARKRTSGAATLAAGVALAGAGRKRARVAGLLETLVGLSPRAFRRARGAVGLPSNTGLSVTARSRRTGSVTLRTRVSIRARRTPEPGQNIDVSFTCGEQPARELTSGPQRWDMTVEAQR